MSQSELPTTTDSNIVPDSATTWCGFGDVTIYWDDASMTYFVVQGDSDEPTVSTAGVAANALDRALGAVPEADWADAVAYCRDHYDESYDNRVKLGADIARFADEHDFVLPSALGGEAVLQPLIRYPAMEPVDVAGQIERKAGEDGPLIKGVIIAFALAEAARTHN